MRTTYHVTGTLQGPLWWPIGELAQKTFSWDIADRSGRPESLRELADCIMAREDGDFSGAARMMADTTLTITRWHATGHHGRTWDLAQFPSLADYTCEDWPNWDDES